MSNKSLLLGLTVAALSTAAIADENLKIEMNGQKVTVYENFAIEAKDEAVKNVTNSEDSANAEVIADLGEFQAVNASGNDGSNIALIVSDDKDARTYAITSEIRYVCNANTSNCMPDGIQAERIGNTDIYKIEVSNFNEWQATMKILKNSEAVKKIFPGYNYGKKNVIN